MFYQVQVQLEEGYVINSNFDVLNEKAEAKLLNISDDNAHFVISEVTESIIKLIGVTFVDYEFKQNSINKLVQEYLKDCEIEYSSFQIELKTYDYFDNLLEKYHRTMSHNTSISFDVLAFQSTVKKYSFRSMETNEYIVNSNVSLKSYEYKTSFDKELKRISSIKQSKFLGHPVHYKLIGDSVYDAISIGKNLVFELYQHKRLIYPYFVEFFPRVRADLSRIDLHDINMVDGGCCFFDLSDRVFEEHDDPMVENFVRMLSNLVLENHHQILFMFFATNSESRAMRLLDQNLNKVRFYTIAEDMLDYSIAKGIIEENLYEIDLDISYASEILDNQKVYKAKELSRNFNHWYDNYLSQNIYKSYQEVDYTHTFVPVTQEHSAFDQLQDMIGLEEIKEMVKNYLDYQLAKEMYAQNGISLPQLSQHMVFKGNPGTAKTSVARLIGKIMKENRLLSVGDFYEVSRAEIIDKYVGWTARNVKSIFNKAMGSVLFIDEAYSLVDSDNNRQSYGDEAIATIVSEMENRRDDIIVIFAGYPKEMDEFLKQNTGLSSRIGFQFDFKDYSNHELIQIAHKIAKDIGFTIKEESLPYIESHLKDLRKQLNFGNGRNIRTLIEKAIIKHSINMLSLKTFNQSLTELYPEDFEFNSFDVNRIDYRTLRTGVH